MNYEEKYNDLLSRIKRMADVQPDVTRVAIESLFPELKESEDERIRKALINGFNKLDKSAVWYNGITNGQILAWLEKQGEQNPFDYENIQQNDFALKSAMEAIKEEKVDNQNCVKPANKVEPKFKVKYAGSVYNVFETKYIAGVTFYGIEDEPNHIDYVQAENCEIVSEQKPTDKIEPKFKVGDWVMYCGKPYQITGLRNDTFTLTSCDGSYFFNNVKSTYEPVFHLWTIQDAKDGNVLSCESGWTCIFKALNSDISFSSYCFMDADGWFCENGSECHTLNEDFVKAYDGELHPATKEQRDQLEKAMADAGYTFDFEKKELKKIEQKPAYTKEYDFHGMKFVPKFAKGDIIKDKKRSEVSIIKDFSYDTGLYTHTYGQFPITIQDNYEIIEQKPAEWHREDEQNLNACLGYIPDELLRRWLMDAIYAKYDKQMQVVTLIEGLKK